MITVKRFLCSSLENNMDQPDPLKIRVNAALVEANYFIQHAAIIQNLTYAVSLLQQRNAELEHWNAQLQGDLERLRPPVPNETPPAAP